MNINFMQQSKTVYQNLSKFHTIAVSAYVQYSEVLRLDTMSQWFIAVVLTIHNRGMSKSTVIAN